MREIFALSSQNMPFVFIADEFGLTPALKKSSFLIFDYQPLWWLPSKKTLENPPFA